MELKTFVKQSIIDIIEAVADARDAIDKRRAGKYYDRRQGIVIPANEGEDEGLKESEIEFDIAVTDAQGRFKEGGGKIAVLNIGISAKGAQATNNQVVNRIRFRVPIAYRFKRKRPVQKK